MDASRLRPLRVGEVLDVAIKVYRHRFADLTKAVSVIVVPVGVLNVLVTLSASTLDDDTTTTSTFTDGFGLTSTSTSIDTGELWTFVAGFLIVAVLTWFATQLATAACFDIVSGTYLDREPDWRESLALAWRRAGSLVWLELVYGVFLLLAFIACVLPGIYFYVAWAVAVPVLLFEDLRGRAALKRSRELLRGRWWPAAAVLILVTILGGILGTAIQGLLLAVVTTTDNELVDALASGISQTAASILTTPFAAAATCVLYYDALVRKEGFDLQQLAAGFGVEPAALPAEGPVDDGTGEQPPFWPPPPGWRPSR